MKKLKLAASRLTLIGTSLYSLPALGGSLELSRSITSLLDFDSSYYSAEERRSIASEVLAYWRQFESRVPHLSPAELAWLEAELASSDSARQTRVLNSSEFAINFISRLAHRCTESAEAVIDSMERANNTETFFWLKVVDCYIDDSDTLIYLKQAGLSNGRADGEFFTALNHYILGAVVRDIAPSSLADAMGWKVE